MSNVLVISTSLRAKSNSGTDCFEKAEFAGSLFCGGINDAGEAAGKTEEQQEAWEFGRTLK